MDSLKEYLLPDAIKIGEWIELDDANVKFLCRTPNEFNREYQRAYYGGLKPEVDEETGAAQLVATDLIALQESQHKAFVKTCIMKCTDASVDLDLLYDEYPRLVTELYRKAADLGTVEVEIADDLGKKQNAS